MSFEAAELERFDALEHFDALAQAVAFLRRTDAVHSDVLFDVWL